MVLDDAELADAVEASLQGNTLREADGVFIGSYRNAHLVEGAFVLHGCSIRLTDWARDVFREVMSSTGYKSTLKLCEGGDSGLTLEGAWVLGTSDLTITIAFDQYTTHGM